MHRAHTLTFIAVTVKMRQLRHQFPARTTGGRQTAKSLSMGNP
nr:hypothetical protein [Klebsiella grimontii]